MDLLGHLSAMPASCYCLQGGLGELYESLHRMPLPFSAFVQQPKFCSTVHCIQALFTVEKVLLEHWTVPNLATFNGPLCTCMHVPVCSGRTVKREFQNFTPISLSFSPLPGLFSREPPPRPGPPTHQLLPADGDGPGLPLQPGGLHAQNARKAPCALKR